MLVDLGLATGASLTYAAIVPGRHPVLYLFRTTCMRKKAG